MECHRGCNFKPGFYGSCSWQALGSFGKSTNILRIKRAAAVGLAARENLLSLSTLHKRSEAENK